MELIAIVEDAWGWTGLRPAVIVGDNDFGNLIVKDETGHYWRLCPEDLSCKVVASSRLELDQLSQDQAFLRDWHMKDLTQRARASLGPLQPGSRYCLKIPGALGGEYGGDNLATISLGELISASGQIARQIEGAPDGAQIKLSIVTRPSKAITAWSLAALLAALALSLPLLERLTAAAWRWYKFAGYPGAGHITLSLRTGYVFSALLAATFGLALLFNRLARRHAASPAKLWSNCAMGVAAAVLLAYWLLAASSLNVWRA